MLGFVWDHFFFEADAGPLTFAGAAMLVGVPLALTSTAEGILQRGSERAGSIATSLLIECLWCIAMTPTMVLLLLASVVALVIAFVARPSYPDGAL